MLTSSRDNGFKMIDVWQNEAQWATVAYQIQRGDRYRQLWLAMLLGASLALALTMFVLGPTPLPLGGMLFLGTLIVIGYQPRWGLYFVLFFALMGDAVLMVEYPFVKNLSSVESLLYVHDSLIFSPLELYLMITLFAWIGKGLFTRQLRLRTGVMLWPVLLFTTLLIVGLVWGIGTGGNVNVALWESRSIFYLPIIMILTINLIDNRRQVSTLIWVIMSAVFVKGIIGVIIFFTRHHGSLAGVEAITEHAAAIHMNALYVLVFASWLFQASLAKRVLLPLMVPLVTITYIATQRRAAFASLGMVMVMMTMILYRTNRRLFWTLVPTVSVFALLYLAAFWNSGSALAFGAKAVKSIIAPDAGSADESSNLYRVLENINIAYTIKQAPLLGVGFGQKFHITVAMPDISFFVWWEYIVHNSVFWIWLKSGLLGFLTIMTLMGFSLMRGGRMVWRIQDNDLQAIAFTITAYLFMHYMYAYVDMSWDAQSMLFVGTALGLIDCLERIDTQNRWMPSVAKWRRYAKEAAPTTPTTPTMAGAA
jgi:hypothetical protein